MGLDPNGAQPGTPRPRVLGHEELLTLSRKVAAAASDGDQSRVAVGARRLADALNEHLDAERHALLTAPVAQRPALRAGQDRLRELLDDIVGSSHDTLLPCRCVELANNHLLAELTLQAHHEHLELGRLEP